MFYVYVLKSLADEELYIGSTRDLKKRIGEHNKGKNKSTKLRIPLSLVYYEAYAAEADARSREKMLKLRGQSRYQLKLRIKESLKAK
mgnify:CR=1 FL=1